MELTIQTPDDKKLVSEAQGALTLAEAFTIDSPEVYAYAADELKGIKSRIKALDDERKKITKPLDDAKKAVMDLFRKPIELLTQTENTYKRAMLAYDNEQRRIAAEQQAEIAKKAAAERARIEAEAKKAEQAEQAGQPEAAAALHTAAAIVTAPTVAPPVTKTAGISTRSVWKAEVTDKRALLEFVLANYDTFEHVVQPDMKAISELARAMKANLNVPGLKAVEEQTMSARAA